MALDGVFLFALKEDFNKNILNGKIDKINQPEKDEILLSIRNQNRNYKLLISASASYPRIHFTQVTKSNPMQPPMFCMVLRKYLTGSKIISIDQVDGDRILVIKVESTDEMGFNSIYSLIVEIMGRHSNITLVRSRDNLIMDSIKHITPDINSYRSLYPSIEYTYPPSSSKLNPWSFNKEQLQLSLEKIDNPKNEGIFSQIFVGVSKLLSIELSHRLESNAIDVGNNDVTSLYSFLKDYFQTMYNGNFKFRLYADENKNFKEFYCAELVTLNKFDSIAFNDPSTVIDRFYVEKDKQDRLNQKSSDLQRLVSTNIERCNKKTQILENTLKDCRSKDKYQLYGELLTANIYSLQKGMDSIEVLNYYVEGEEYIKITMDIYKTPSENIQAYYKRYNKLKKSEEAALEQLKNNQEEMEYLQSVLSNIKNCENYNEIEEIRKELVETGYIRFKKDFKKNKNGISKPIHFKSTEGFDIYVGKNNLQNDFLTLKFADKQDIWMHTKNIPGSHVIIKNNGKITDKVLEEAAILASFYSKAKDSTKVPVDYTEVRNVKKPSGAKPGMVIYYTNKTIYVDPYEIQLEKLN